MPIVSAPSFRRFAFVCLILSLLTATRPADAAKPIVPGFERFHRDAKADLPAGGRLLLGELNCTNCHKPPAALGKSLRKKQAPILDAIGARVSVEYLRKYLTDPHAVKPGTTMPRVFAGLSETDRRAKVEALVHFLASTGNFRHTLPNAAAGNGEKLYHTVGCVACHGVRKPGTKSPAAAVPLGKPDKKYNVTALSNYLRDPLKTRPSGRMPSLNLAKNEADAIAAYFLRDVKVPSNLTFKYYEGNWPNLPDFSKLKPKATGGVAGFNLRIARRKSNFAIQFEGWLQVERAGEYTFHLGSDDGARLFVDGENIVDVDGVHPVIRKSGKLKLQPGPHKLIVDYAQVGGGAELYVDYQGPGISRRKLASAVTSTKQPPTADDGFKLDPKLVAQGRSLFRTVGCANCHELKENRNSVASTLAAKPLSDLRWDKGCVAPKANASSPMFDLSTHQLRALQAAVKTPPKVASADAEIHKTLVAMNCYACHKRNKVGGPLEQLDAEFVTTIKEMGREGRIPPPLDGVGDKLTDAWLKHVLANGANDRPYMLTRMPKFGDKNIGHLAGLFAKADRKALVKTPKMSTTVPRMKGAGRSLVGEKAFACIKCHTWGKHKATGIQSIDLTQMTKRIRRDWFFRYMMKPIRYRPGTRMPTPFPGGISTIDNVLKGDPQQQLLAMWTFIADGTKARTPNGLIRGAIELRPIKEPIIYRNFIQGVSPRGIAVGYPGGFNLAFDADKMVLAMLWHGNFIDAGKHWRGRGQGFQPPLGDHLLALPRDLPFARLATKETKWPTTSTTDAGYKFLGYRLDKQRQPIFRYRFGDATIEDHPTPVKSAVDPFLRRTLTITQSETAASGRTVYFLAATTATTIKPLKSGWYQVGEQMRLRMTTSDKSKPIIRKSGGRYELLLPVTLNGKPTTITQEIVW